MLQNLKTAAIVALVSILIVASGATAASLITGKQIKNGSLTGQDVKNKSLTKKDFRGSVRGPRGFTGPAGPINAAGMTRVEATTTVAAGDVNSATVACPSGQALITPEFSAIGADSEVFYVSDFGVRDSLSVGLDNFDSPIDATVTAEAWCVPSGKAVIASVDKAKAVRRANAANIKQLTSHR